MSFRTSVLVDSVLSSTPCLVYILSFLSIGSSIFVPPPLLGWGLLSDCAEPISWLSAPLGRKLDWLLERFQRSLISGNIFALKWKVIEAEARLSCNLGHHPLLNPRSLNLCNSSNRMNHSLFFLKLLSLVLYVFIKFDLLEITHNIL